MRVLRATLEEYSAHTPDEPKSTESSLFARHNAFSRRFSRQTMNFFPPLYILPKMTKRQRRATASTCEHNGEQRRARASTTASTCEHDRPRCQIHKKFNSDYQRLQRYIISMIPLRLCIVATFFSRLGPFGPLWAFLGPFGPLWAFLGPVGPFWAIFGPFMFLHTYIPAYFYSCILMFVHTYIRAYLYPCILIFLHTYIPAYLYS